MDPRFQHGVWLLLLGLTVAVLVVPATRARASGEPEPTLTTEAAADSPANAPSPIATPAMMTETGTWTTRTTLAADEEQAIVARARLEIDRVTIYDSSWMQTSSYPMGDVPSNRGACTDVVVRSLRAIGFDLQELVHDDVARDPAAYGVTGVDPNIDHRRLSMMFTFFVRNALSLTTELHDRDAWRAGDIVFVAWQWKRGAAAEHVVVLSDRIGARGLPLVIENGGPRPTESDSLGHGKIVGHFRALQRR